MMKGTRRPREGTQMNRRRLGMPNGARERTRKPPEMVTKGPNSEHPNEPQSEARRQPARTGVRFCSAVLSR